MLTLTEPTQVHDPLVQADWQRVRDSGIGEVLAGYNLALALSMVEETGMARRLMAPGGCTREQLAHGLDDAMAAGLIDYLVIRGVVVEENGALAPTHRGRCLMSEVPMALLGYYHDAYSPVLRSGASLLSRRASYGADVERDHEALGKHCEVLFRSFGTSVVLRMLESMGARCLLDLGCGSGGLLIDACARQPELRAIGLDIAPDVIRYGQDRVAAAGLSDRIRMVVGDAFRPDTWPDVCAEADAILIAGTLHEHFRCGEDAVIDVLNGYADFLAESGGGLILAEPELYRDAVDADFFLVHTFTRQGYPRTGEAWLELFDRTRLRCVEMAHVPDTGFRFRYFHLVHA